MENDSVKKPRFASVGRCCNGVNYVVVVLSDVKSNSIRCKWKGRVRVREVERDDQMVLQNIPFHDKNGHHSRWSDSGWYWIGTTLILGGWECLRRHVQAISVIEGKGKEIKVRWSGAIALSDSCLCAVSNVRSLKPILTISMFHVKCTSSH